MLAKVSGKFARILLEAPGVVTTCSTLPFRGRFQVLWFLRPQSFVALLPRFSALMVLNGIKFVDAKKLWSNWPVLADAIFFSLLCVNKDLSIYTTDVG